MRYFLLLFGLLLTAPMNAQEAYQFTPVIDLEATPVISQGITGTCWSFSSTSFLESEIIRIKGEAIDLSEMFTVRNTYPKKAANYVMRQGKAQFSEGGLAHDVMNAVATGGLVPNDAYSGLWGGKNKHNHAEMVAVLTSMLETYVRNPGRSLSPTWKESIDAVLDRYLGKKPETFYYNGTEYNPMSFLEMTGLQPADYVNITSFNHAPFYEEFILNIPDNWSNGAFYNVPLDDMMQAVDHALDNGYSVELDCDVSERTFSSKDGVAIIPLDKDNNKKALKAIYPEKKVDQTYRQQEFESYATTDDHLMHITGTLTDQNGTRYYKVKNSWGSDPSRNANGGYVYFSESYMRLKTISITLHKDAVPDETAKKLNL